MGGAVPLPGIDWRGHKHTGASDEPMVCDDGDLTNKSWGGSMTKPQKAAMTEAIALAGSRKSLFERVAGFLDANDWNYASNQDKNFFETRARVKDASVRIVLDVYEAEDWQRVLTYTTLPVYIPENRRGAVAESLNRINFGMTFGGIEMDCQDGEVRIKTVVESDGELGERLLERALHVNLNTTNLCLAPILAVAFGNAAPETVRDLMARQEEALQ
jgi:hypothetical protein